MILDRRALILSAIAMTACGEAIPQSDKSRRIGPVPSFKDVAPFPVGCAVTRAQVEDPAFANQLIRNFSQVTPEHEMKMSTILRPNGDYDFSKCDPIADFARTTGLRLHGHTLIWYKRSSGYFEQRRGDPAAFREAYNDFITKMMQRYADVATSWDVVNEVVAPDGSAMRETLWTQMLGADEHIILAFDIAARAHPGSVHFINEFDLERLPEKRLTFMRMMERLLKKGAKIGGIGTQTHLNYDLPKGAMAETIKDIGSLGLPIHLSELDISIARNNSDTRPISDKLEDQGRKAAEVADAFMSLPSKQQFAFSLWGMLDRDSWLRTRPYPAAATDQPLAFDDQGNPKPMAEALATAFARRR